MHQCYGCLEGTVNLALFGEQMWNNCVNHLTEYERAGERCVIIYERRMKQRLLLIIIIYERYIRNKRC